jgi:hypothetical protein
MQGHLPSGFGHQGFDNGVIGNSCPVINMNLATGCPLGATFSTFWVCLLRPLWIVPLTRDQSCISACFTFPRSCRCASLLDARWHHRPLEIDRSQALAGDH